MDDLLRATLIALAGIALFIIKVCVICFILLFLYCRANNFDAGPKAAGAEPIIAVQGSCWVPARPLPGPASPRSSPGYRWEHVPDEDEQVALFDGDRYIGNFSYRWNCFRPIIGNGWGDPCRPPIKPPERVVIPQPVPTFKPGSRDVRLDQEREELLPSPVFLCDAVDDALPTGVDLDKLGKGPEFRICDESSCRPISRLQAIEAIEKGLPDDAHKLRLTIIGTREQRKRIDDDLATAANADIRDKVNVWSVEPSHWSVADAGFKTDGNPTIYLQLPSGKVIGREDSYDGPPTLEAIRKRVASYDASKDLTIKVQPVFKVDLPLVQLGTLAALAGVAGVLAIRKGKS